MHLAVAEAHDITTEYDRERSTAASKSYLQLSLLQLMPLLLDQWPLELGMALYARLRS